MEGTFTLAKGTKLKILIDQEGHHSAVFSDMPGSGGGGTFVTLLDDAPLIIAGEGGGGGTPKKQFEDGDPGQATENGTRCGGMGGNGGQPCNADTGNVDPGILAGGGGGGWAQRQWGRGRWAYDNEFVEFHQRRNRGNMSRIQWGIRW